MSKPKAIAIMGPTASGKSALALALAQEFGGEIISADSAQVYAGPDIGTAKPDKRERSLVPHHLIDIRTLKEPFSLADFKELAQNLIFRIWEAGRIPFVVGGSGLYLRGLCEGYTLIETPPDPELRERLNSLELPELLNRLAKADPQTYEKIDRCNKRRIVRSLEVIEQTGRSFTELSRCTPPPFEVLKLGLHWERQALFARIDLRLKEMMAQGWPEEAERLYREGFAEDLRCLRILGYPELLDAIEGKITLPEAEELIRLATHRFAKRQQTWFKKEPELHTLSAGEEAYSEACRLIREFLRH
ncbi:tRNA (adenosine(37)-N6)-dimethylallyltransferase MiaA [bacterium]|nr:tRNA (adenosine(37)-N6)-dimethylallyltransferase MiaA [bacterium]